MRTKGVLVRNTLIGLVIGAAALLTTLQCSDPVSPPECDGPGSLPNFIALFVRHETVVDDDGLTVRFDTVPADDRCDEGLDSCTGLATVRLKLWKSGSDSATIDMVAWSDPPYPDSGPFLTVDTLGYYFTLLMLTPHSTGGRHLPYSTYWLWLEAIRKNSADSVRSAVIPSVGAGPAVLNAFYWVSTAYVHGDSLALTVGYTGGCEKHYFVPYLLFEREQDMTKGHADLFLHHLDNGDTCRAPCSATLQVDLSPIKRLCGMQNSRGRLRRQMVVDVYEYTYYGLTKLPRLVTSVEYAY